MASKIIKPWSAVDFFKRLTESNKLCQEKNFKCVTISGLEGLEEAIARLQSTPNLICVVENAAGYTMFDNTPHTRKVRTVFISMRHKLDDMEARQRCMDTIYELHRQFCSMLIMEKTRLSENMQFLNPQINLQEVSKYLIPGTAICMFELSVDTYIDLQYNPDEWSTPKSN
jgi:hypothetical protein